MKAQVFRGVNQLSYEEIPVPHLEADEVLVQVRVVGLCQSDIKKIRYPLYEPPRIFGHETAGVIAAVGSQVKDWQIGQRVAVMHHIPCMHCAYCLNDNFSMYIVRNGGLIPIPEQISFEEASFVEPTNCCLKAVKKAQIAPGQTVLVTGAGPIGLMFIMLVKYFGAQAIATDLIPARIEKAVKLGADAAFDARDANLTEKITALTHGMGVDVTILAVPSEKAFFQSLNCTRKGGKILFFAEVLYRREIDLMGSYSSSYRLQSLAAEIIFNRRIDVQALISDRYPLKDLSTAIAQAVVPTDETCKILIYP